MSTSSAVAKFGGLDAVKRILVSSTKFAMAKYESSSGNKLPEAFKTTIESFVDTYIGAALPAIVTGKLDKLVARDALLRCLKLAGIADETGWADCGIAMFSVGVTAYDAAKNTVTAGRVASIASASGVGAAPGAVLVASTFLYGVFITFKDYSDARVTCDKAISKQAEKEKRPAAIIDGKGYGLGSISTAIGVQKGANMSLMKGA